MSPETIKINKICIINAAIELIRETGIRDLSARSLGARAGINSALIYRYFADIDEAVLFACVHVLQEYTRDMVAAEKQYNASVHEPDDRELYLLSWEQFCLHAFSDPEAYATLFFSRHSADLPRVIRDYYDLFPDEVSSSDDIILSAMFQTADLKNRNLILLVPVLEGRKSQSEIILINEMTIAFFYSLLLKLIEGSPATTPDSQTNRMLDAVRYTIES